MFIEKIILKNFRCFGEEPTEISFDEDVTFFVGNNGSGKTTVFTALKRLFGETREDRTVIKEDFHIKPNETSDDIQNKEMFIEVLFAFPEMTNGIAQTTNTFPAFDSVIYTEGANRFKARMRLEAKWTNEEYEDEVESKLYWIISSSEIGFGEDFENKSTVSIQDRKIVQLRYIPAFRDSGIILKNNVQNLVKLIANYADLEEETAANGGNSKLDEIKRLNDELGNEVRGIRALSYIKKILDKNWVQSHDNSLKHYQETQFEITSSDITKLLKSITLKLSPTESGCSCNVEELSDGQISLLYFALAITLYEIEQAHIKNEIIGLKDYDKIPATFTIFALEEPENHISPFYLGRILTLLSEKLKKNNIISLVASHSASVIRRVEKLEQIRYFRQEITTHNRLTRVKTIILPENREEEDYKFINQAVLAHPELYFAKLVILGEGDSEEIIIPRMASKLGVDLDPSFASVVKLGGRHVNHMWRLLENLEIPYITLLDQDLGRQNAGVKRFKYAIDELIKLGTTFNYPEGINYRTICDEQLDGAKIILIVEELKTHNIFFSGPLDLDMSMIKAFPEYYSDNSNIFERSVLEKAVLGDNGKYSIYTDLGISLSDDLLKKYKYLFCSKSKVVAHYTAIEEIMKLKPVVIESKCPKTIKELINKAKELINEGGNNEN